VDVELSPVLRTPDDLRRASPLMLDLTEDAVILQDDGGLLAQAVNDLRTRMARLGSRRIWVGTRWYWDSSLIIDEARSSAYDEREPCPQLLRKRPASGCALSPRCSRTKLIRRECAKRRSSSSWRSRACSDSSAVEPQSNMTSVAFSSSTASGLPERGGSRGRSTGCHLAASS